MVFYATNTALNSAVDHFLFLIIFVHTGCMCQTWLTPSASEVIRHTCAMQIRLLLLLLLLLIP